MREGRKGKYCLQGRRQHGCYVMPGLLVRLFVVSATGGGLVRRALAGDASGPALPVRGGDGEVDVLLGIHADHKLRHVHELLAHPVFFVQQSSGRRGKGRNTSKNGEQSIYSNTLPQVLSSYTHLLLCSK